MAALTRSAQTGSLTRIIVAYIGFIGIGINSVLLNLAWRPMSEEFGQPIEAIGLLLLSGTLGYLISSFVAGTVASRLGIGWTTFLGAAALATSISLTSVLSIWLLVVLIYALGGVGGGLIDAAFNAYVAEHHSKRTLNWLHASFGIGATIGPTLVTLVLVGGGAWRNAYLLTAAFLGALVVVLFIMRNRWLPIAAQAEAQAGNATSIGQTLRLPVVWLGIALFFIYGGTEFSPGQWVSTLFTEARGIPLETAGFWVSIYWGSFTVGRIFFGAIINMVPANRLMRACMAAMVAGAGLLWWGPTPEVGFFGLALLGFAQAPMFPVFISQAPVWMGARHAPNAIGFQVAGASLGIAVVPSLIGLVATDSPQVIPAFFFTTAVLVVIVYELMNRLHARQT